MSLNHPSLSICFISHFAYGAITGGNTGHAGGVEYQTSSMARWLAERGHKVSLLTWGDERDENEVVDGVHVIKLCRQNEGMKGLRFFYPRWTSLNQAMKKADADLYYHNCAEYVTGQAALWCRRHGRKFVYSVASDPECERFSPPTRKFRDRVFYQYGLRRADRIIVQTRKQQQMLLKNFALDASFIPMPCWSPPIDGNPKLHTPTDGPHRVLWIGRIDKEKRLELLLDAAESLPKINFDIAGKPTSPENPYSRNLIARADALPNVTLHGMIPRNQLQGLYHKASFLCCTSLYEGFPNTFLEAWSCGLPVVSTCDPDNLIRTRLLGLVVKDKSELVSDIQSILNDLERRRAMSENSRKYYEENHTPDQSMKKFIEQFIDVLRRRH